MFSLVMYRDMNRSEQENLYRTSRKLSLVPINLNHSHSNLHENIRRHSFIKDEYTTIPPSSTTTTTFSDDLVLSVLKSPINHIQLGTAEVKDTDCGVETTAAAPDDDDDDDDDDEDDEEVCCIDAGNSDEAR